MATTSISYTQDAKPLARTLAAALCEHGVEAWTDLDFRPGQPRNEELDRAIDEAEKFVVLVGPKSLTGESKRAEWQAILTRVWEDPKKQLVPVIVGKSPIPACLRDRTQVHIDPEAKPRDWTRPVIDAIKSTNLTNIETPSAKTTQERRKRLEEMSRALATLEDKSA
jgi:hypothetical protein